MVQIASGGAEEAEAFDLLVTVVGDIQKRNGKPSLSGLKNEVRKRQEDFSEKKFGYSGFLQFCRAAARRGLIDLEFDQKAGDYRVTVV
jgi:hypothetical protein